MDGVELLAGEIAQALERGATVVTGNQRAARTLRRGWDERNRRLGLVSWMPPVVMAWDSWIAALWRGLLIEGHAAQMLLNRTQEHAVWRSILERDDELASLRSVDSLAEMAAEAWRLVCRYNGQQRLRSARGSTDTRAFQRWAAAFERVCMTREFLGQAQLEEALRGAMESRLLLPPAGEVLLVGFDGLTPAQAGFVDALRSAEVKVEELQPAADVVRRVFVETEDEREELFVAARWVREFLENQPEAKVAVIVPGLDAERSEIDRVFREVLSPELEDIRADNHAGPYEFSLGGPLAETAMVATALDLLRWVAAALPVERVSELLLSPYFAMTSEERAVRAEFDAFELRKTKMLRAEISLDGIVSAVERSKRRGQLPQLLRVLRAMRMVANRTHGLDARSNAAWAERMRELLEVAGWGSIREESSIEFQTQRKWESTLDELATLDFDGVPTEFVTALEAVERIARQTTFAPESREAPVQVMGPFESTGTTFDAVWFLHAGELTWPVERRSSSLLPWPMQHELKMPGTDVARDNEYAREMTKRIAGCAGTVVFSYAKETVDGRQRCSPVIAGLGLDSVSVSAADLIRPVSERRVVEMEEVEDVARVQALPDGVIRGGARILELQAACGFRAFAEQRLWATELESIEPGMNARESGTVVHEALSLFWREVRTQKALKSMTREERDEVVTWCVTEALKKTEAASVTAWDAAYLEVQRDRFGRLLDGWLELEMERGLPFEVKLSEKEFKDVHVGPLRLDVRVDRVDVVEGGEVLIDYKTGEATPTDWLTERPDAPQLPLYAILSEADRLQGVAFGLVRAGEGRGLKGYAVGDHVLAGKPVNLKEAATLEAQIERWRQVLVKLAEEFYAGDARVNPKQYPVTCMHCGQRMLCRLDASLLEEGEEDDGGPAEVDRG